MPLQFHRSLEPLEIWSAASDGFSFVISCTSPDDPGLRDQPGFVATWRPLYKNVRAIKVTGGPFMTFADAEEACNTMSKHLTVFPRGV